MAELLGARIFLEAMRETRHGRIRKQQVNRDRYTASSEKLISVVHSSQMQHTEHKTQRKKRRLSICLEAGFRTPLLRYIYYTLYLVYHYTVYLDYTVYTLQWLEWKGATNSVSIHSLHDRINSLYTQPNN